MVEAAGADIVDINFGCPVRKVTKTGAGASLLDDPDHAARIVEAVAGATALPVSVKMRRGTQNGSRDCLVVGPRLVEAGAASLTLHPRSAKQMYTGTADHSLTAELVELVDVPVIASGDVTSRARAQAVLATTGAAAVMVGRAAQGNPWALAQIMGDDGDPTREEVVAELLLFIRETVRELGEQRATSFLKKFYAWYLGRGRFPKPFKQELVMLADDRGGRDAPARRRPGRASTCSSGSRPRPRRWTRCSSTASRSPRTAAAERSTSRRRAGSARSRGPPKTTAIPTDQATASQTSLPTGMPRKSPRTALTMIVNGLFSATGCSQLGIDATGTNADETNVSGKRIVNPYAFAASGEDAARPTKANTQEKQYPISSSSAMPGDDVADPGLEVEADEQPDAEHDDELHDVRADVRERPAGEDGRARHRQRPEAVHQPLLQVLGEPERGDEAAEGHRLHDDPRDQEVDVAEARASRSRRRRRRRTAARTSAAAP